MSTKDSKGKVSFEKGKITEENYTPEKRDNLTPVEDIEEALKEVIDPELGVNVVDLGLLYGVGYADDDAVLIDMTLTTAACPLTDVIEEQISQVLDPIVDDWRLNWVWMPPWGPERITDDGREQMRALGFNL
ncbi:MAG: metal-sulfur cluster assembly factor [Micrococcaceae bacterium]